MKKIKKEELYANLKQFLKSRGIDLQEGTYTERIRKGCGVLTDSVNLSQDALMRAKTAVDGGLDHLRQVIHEKTAPKPPPVQPQKPKAAKRPARKT